MTKWIIQKEETDYYCDDVYFQDLLGNCAIYGNRAFKEFMPEWFDTIINATQLEYMLDDIYYFITDLGMPIEQAVSQTLDAYLDLPVAIKQDTITPENAQLIYDALKNQYYYSSEKTLCQLLSAITSKEWDYATIRGYCQSDWNDLYYPDDGTVNISLIEAEYFGLYTYYSVHADDFDDENDMVLMRVYDFDDIKDVFKKEFGNLLKDGDTIEMRRIKGYTQVPCYKSETIELQKEGTIMLNEFTIRNFNDYLPDDMIFHVGTDLNIILFNELSSETSGNTEHECGISDLLNKFKVYSWKMDKTERFAYYSCIVETVSRIVTQCKIFRVLYNDKFDHSAELTDDTKKAIQSAFKQIMKLRAELSVYVNITDKDTISDTFDVTMLGYCDNKYDYLREEILQSNYPTLFQDDILPYVDMIKLQNDTLNDMQRQGIYFVQDVYDSGFTYMVEF